MGDPGKPDLAIDERAEPSVAVSMTRQLADLSFEVVESGAFVEGSELLNFNPDELTQNKGKGVKLYQDMVRDPYVKAGMEFKKSAVLAMPWSVQPASSDPRDVEIAVFFQTVFTTMQHPFSRFLESAMDALDCGYSIVEKVYGRIPQGKYRGKWGIDRLASKDPAVYEFRLDKFSRVKAVTSRFTSEEHPPHKFFIFSHRPRYENPYGMSDLRAAYRAFFIKDLVWKFRALYLERFGMPPVLGYFPPGTSDAKRKELLKILKTMQTESVMTIPNDIVVKALEIATLGKQTEYERAIADLNKEILVGILLSFQPVEEGKRVGSRVSSREGRKVTQMAVERLAHDLEQDIDRQIIRHLGWFNFNVDQYPNLVFDIADDDRDLTDLEIDKALRVDLNVPMSNDYFYRKYRRNPPSVEQVTPDQQPFSGAQGPAGQFLRYVEHRRRKGRNEAGNGDVRSLKSAWREILDFCESRDNVSYPTEIAHNMAKWEAMYEEKFKSPPTSDEAAVYLSTAILSHVKGAP